MASFLVGNRSSIADAAFLSTAEYRIMYKGIDSYSLKSFGNRENERPVPDNRPDANGSYPTDIADLRKFGKKQQLKRRFSLLSIIGLTCTLMVTWEGTLTAFQSGLLNGGPAGLVYGFIFTWIGTVLQALVMAEMASMIPLSGGQYNWVAVLAPRSCSNFLSYLTGWMSIISWQAAFAGAAFLGSQIIQGLATLNHPNYVPERWQGTLIFYAVVAFGLFVNTYLARLLPSIEAVVLVLHIIGFFCVLIPLVYLGPHESASSVFATFTNAGGWGDKGLSWFVGLSTSMFAFIGCDAASHMAEEIGAASTVIPRSMIASVVLNGALGFAMVLATLFCLGDVQAALSTPTGLPFLEVFYNATGTALGATLMASIIVAAMIFSNIGFLATASRMAWAFAREKGLPGSSILSRVEPRTCLPIYTIALSTCISMLLALINIGSTTAFNALISLVISSFYSTFTLSASVLLHKRLTTRYVDIPWGPFRLGRVAGIPIIVLSIVFSVIGIFFSFWPAAPGPTAVTMNWSVAVFGGTLLFSLAFWVVYGRHVYVGPLREFEIQSS